MEDQQLERIQFLINQEKYTQAKKTIYDYLSSDPNNVYAHTFLSDIYYQEENHEKALESINTAIGSDPSIPGLYYLKSRINIEQNELNDAEKNILLALTLDSSNADFHALYANIKLIQKQFEEALEHANNATKIDPRNIAAINLRSKILIKLNRSAESFTATDFALKEDPNNPYTHSNYAWNLLEKGDNKKALIHFHEALILNANLDHAQIGLLEALKANNIFYRGFLNYSFWMGNLTKKNQWGVIIGFYIFIRIINYSANKFPSLAPYLNILTFVLVIIAFSTWIISPISNLFLRFNKYGKILLSKKEKNSSNLVAISLATSIIGLLLYLITQDANNISIALFGLLMMLPCGTMINDTKSSIKLILYSIILALLGLNAIKETFVTNDLFNSNSVFFLLAFVGYQWYANYVIIQESKY